MSWRTWAESALRSDTASEGAALLSVGASRPHAMKMTSAAGTSPRRISLSPPPALRGELIGGSGRMGSSWGRNARREVGESRILPHEYTEDRRETRHACRNRQSPRNIPRALSRFSSAWTTCRLSHRLCVFLMRLEPTPRSGGRRVHVKGPRPNRADARSKRADPGNHWQERGAGELSIEELEERIAPGNISLPYGGPKIEY